MERAAPHLLRPNCSIWCNCCSAGVWQSLHAYVMLLFMLCVPHSASLKHTALAFGCTAAAMPSTKGSRRRTSNASRSDVGSSRLGRLAPSAAGDLPGGAQAGSAAGPSSSRDTGSIKRDYIREQRETKELLKRWVACWVADLEQVDVLVATRIHLTACSR